jgi:hypothetical protein
MQIRPQQCGANLRGTLQRLWLHEHLRVYGDRLVDSRDAKWLRGMLLEVLGAKFDCRSSYEELFDPEKEVVFGERGAFVPPWARSRSHHLCRCVEVYQSKG